MQGILEAISAHSDRQFHPRKEGAPLTPQKQSWWQTTTIYQIYPRSFKDSNGDGIGDIPGIIEKLDYLKDLGVETLWVSPFFSSPQADWGYDISNYRDIAPEYGRLQDAENLIKEVHRRDMKVIFDLVLNHTSIEHPWFVESSKSKDNPRSDWYIWRDGAGKNQPPNNWKALPGGSGWHYHPAREQWYYASFLPFQPDLNFRNPDVKEEMFQTAKFWLEKGVDGFRLDIFHAIYKAEHFQDNPFHWSYIPKDDKYGFFTEWKYTVSQPETIQLAQEMRQFMDRFKPERFMLGEIFAEDQIIKQYLGDGTNGMQAIFLWDLMDFSFKADFFWKVLNKYEKWYPEPYQPILVLGNHDSRRWIDRVDGDRAKAKLIALLQLTARGVPVVYYGEEIGLPEGSLPAGESLDPIGQRYAWAPNWFLKLLNLYVNRDNCRTPMVWDPSPQGGFGPGTAAPWLPLSADPESANAASQRKDPGSLWTWYKSVLKFRGESNALRSGRLQLLPQRFAQDGLLGYTRQAGDERLLVVINFSDKALEVDLKANTIPLQTGKVEILPDRVRLGKLAGAVIPLTSSTPPTSA